MATTPRQILKGRLRQQGYATAGWATGTPHGRDGFARDFEVERKPHHVLYRASTLDNAANLPEEYIGDLGYSGALYDQEVLGLFTAFEGLVYTFQADTDGHVREARGALGSQLPEHGDTGLKSPPDAGISAGLSPSAACAGSSEPRSSSPCAGSSEPRADALSSSASAACAGIRRGVRWTPGMPRAATRWKEVIGGVDWGYTNPTAAVVFGLDGDGRAWQLDEWYQRRAPLDAVVLPALCDLTRRFGVERWWCGPDEPEHIAALQAALIREGLSCRVMAGNDAVRPGIQTITRLLDRRGDGTRGLYVAPRCVHTIAEYLSYQYETSPGGSLRSGSHLPVFGEVGHRGRVSELPFKQNDHAMDATRYALHTALGQSQATQAYLARMRASLQRR